MKLSKRLLALLLAMLMVLCFAACDKDDDDKDKGKDKDKKDNAVTSEIDISNLSPDEAIAAAFENTFSDCGLLFEDLKVFAPDSTKGSVDFDVNVTADGENVSAKGTAAVDGKAAVVSGDVSVAGQTISVQVQFDDKALKANVKPFINRTISYSYNGGTGYLDELLKQADAGISQKDLNDALKAFYSAIAGNGADMTAEVQALVDDLSKKAKSLPIKEIDSQKININGKAADCDGYEVTITADDAKEFVEIIMNFYKDYLKKTMGDLMAAAGTDVDALFDEAMNEMSTEGMDEAKLRIYVNDGKLASIEAVNSEDGSVSGLRFLGGDFRLQNIEVFEGDTIDAKIVGERSGNKETFRVMDGDNNEQVSLTYDRDSHKVDVNVGGEVISFTVNASKDKLEFAMDRLEIEGVIISAKITANANPTMPTFTETNTFELANASEEAFQQFVTEIMGAMS